MLYAPKFEEIKPRIKDKTEITLVLEHLESGKTLTSKEAMRKWEIQNLSVLIKRLEERGHEVCKYKERNEDGRLIKIYSLNFVL